MMHVYPGLTVDTPHGLGVVMAVRDDGMVVTKLVSSGGGAGFTGYFHPSTVGHSSSSSSVGGVVGTVGVARDTASNAFLPTRAAAAAPCMFQPVSSMEHGGFQPMFPEACGVSTTGNIRNASTAMDTAAATQHNQLQGQQQQQHGFHTLDRPCLAPPSKRRRSVMGDFDMLS